jgi:hypothetical protein
MEGRKAVALSQYATSYTVLHYTTGQIDGQMRCTDLGLPPRILSKSRGEIKSECHSDLHCPKSLGRYAAASSGS